MRTVGVIAEYNPFHTGHLYHLEQAKALACADYTIVVLSPDFVQRGTPALFDKTVRTEMALRCGADLVLELPICYASGSAEYFAGGAVGLLDALGCVDALCFGSEHADTDALLSVAAFLEAEPKPYQQRLRSGLCSGMTFPQARADALAACFPAAPDSGVSLSLAALLATPNSILAVEYCRALLRFSSRIQPLALLRLGNGYDSTALEGDYCSASAIRTGLLADRSFGARPELRRHIPKACLPLFDRACLYPVVADDFIPLLTQKLLAGQEFCSVFDLPSELSDRLCKLRFQCIGKSFDELTAFLKTRQITEARIRRALLHLLLGLRGDDAEAFRKNGPVFYARILGFRSQAAPLLHAIRKNSRIPLLSRPASAAAALSSFYPSGSQKERCALRMLEQDFYASHLYRGILSSKYHIPFHPEQQISPVILKE